MKRFLKWLPAFIIVYVISWGFLPYMITRDISEKTRAEVKSLAYTSNSRCVDRVALIEQPIESLGARIHIISNAQKSLDIAYYAMNDDKSTDIFLSSVIAVADKGVSVRIVLDGVANGLKKSTIEALALHENIELKLYNPINILLPYTYNCRMHDKYIIVDNMLLLLGGRNVGDKYFNLESYSGKLSIDRDVCVYNTLYKTDNRESVIYEVKEYMDDIWQEKCSEKVRPTDKKEGEKELKRLRECYEEIKQSAPNLLEIKPDYEKLTVPANKLTFINNGTRPKVKEGRVFETVAHITENAENRVILQSPYIVTNKEIAGLINALGEKQIQYEIITNSLGSTPNIPAYSAYYACKEDILKSGAIIYEFQSLHGIHSKTFIADDNISVVGSFNLDPRSVFINTEIMLVIDSREFCEILSGTMEEYKARSCIVNQNGSYNEACKVSVQEVSKVKKAIVEIAKVPAMLLRHLL